jgi:hypothetical protein
MSSAPHRLRWPFGRVRNGFRLGADQARGPHLCGPFVVELPGIEPVSASWSQSRTGTELRNDIDCDSPELTSVDTQCAQNVPSQSLG